MVKSSEEGENGLGGRSVHSTRWSQISAEIAIFAYPPAFDATLGGPRLKIAVPFGAVKPEWLGYPPVKKSEDTITRLDRIHERDRRTDTARRHRSNFILVNK